MNEPTIDQKLSYGLKELALETTLGELGVERNDITIPVIDLSHFEDRREEITEALWQAAKDVGFFQITNHDIVTSHIEDAFLMSEQFFALDMQQKASVKLKNGLNAGWEFMEQVRPSTGVADQKESFQMTLPHMEGLWLSDEALSGFSKTLCHFEKSCWLLGMKILSCFADKLGFDKDFFTQAHDRTTDTYQNTLRLLHYLPVQDESILKGDCWRAGAHTDFDCLTMVFQQKGQGGLQVCAGKDAENNLAWTSVMPSMDVVTCNIGDMLMRWSDDELKSTLHRVRMPRTNEYLGSRYSMAYFCQANKDVVIQGPKKTYEKITAEDYLQLRIAANFR